MSELASGEDLYQWRQWAIHLAQAHSIDTEEVDWLLQGLTPLSSLSLRLGDYRDRLSILSKADLTSLTAKWQQRISHRVPVQYLAGATPWRNFSIAVSPAVLIPRPETELIIDIAKALAARNPLAEQLKQGHWADIGTGSGAIALGLAQQFPTAIIHATDISPAALAVAQLNAQQNQLAERITFYQGSWLSPLASLRGQLSAIISNPPYIPTQTVLTLQPEVAEHEPHLALDGGPDGLACIRTLIADSTDYLQSGGIWLIELMAGQAETVADLLKKHSSYTDITIHRDLSGIHRFVSARKAL
ncbi:MAG: peptide chain release factor N(5)-glutamine methyltransferase [Phormidesmis priestleyi]|uniref:Release factor glutamine methyltransferase n=1 Tax=Phormidesmis priestleyi TaxID=268141 RepID=A0A2W4XQZ8_9CYAN|nr:MAG: peptide chain release factor N(5)-glutamine methyltransferase [Phormidesmis priestleyi]